MTRLGAAWIAILTMAPLLGGCSSDGTTTPIGLPATESLPKLPALPTVASFTSGPLPTGTPTEIYTRVARGLLTCWFGSNGPLKPTYIYHADATPPSKGGGAVIDIHSRDLAATDPRALRAWRVAIKKGDERPVLEIENFKLAAPMAERLDADVRRWAGDQEGCGEAPVAEGWGASAAIPVVNKKPEKPVKRKP
jgi:hypothetical protein